MSKNLSNGPEPSHCVEPTDFVYSVPQDAVGEFI